MKSFFLQLSFWMLLFAFYAPIVVYGQVDSPQTLPRGSGEIFANGGTAKLDYQWTWHIDAGMRIGLSKRFEIASPLAITYGFLQHNDSGLAVTAGITDLWYSSSPREFIWTPAIVLGGKIRLSQSGTTFFSADYTHVQTNRRASPGYLRAAGALMVDMGPYLTWCIGISYQRILVEQPEPIALHQSGLAGPQRVSIGSVRATPYSSLPLFIIHTGAAIDFTIHIRLDIDTDTDTTDALFLAGLRLHWNRPQTP